MQDFELIADNMPHGSSPLLSKSFPKTIFHFNLSDNITVSHFALAPWKRALVQRRRQCFWIMLTKDFLFA